MSPGWAGPRLWVCRFAVFLPFQADETSLLLDGCLSSCDQDKRWSQEDLNSKEFFFVYSADLGGNFYSYFKSSEPWISHNLRICLASLTAILGESSKFSGLYFRHWNFNLRSSVPLHRVKLSSHLLAPGKQRNVSLRISMSTPGMNLVRRSLGTFLEERRWNGLSQPSPTWCVGCWLFCFVLFFYLQRMHRTSAILSEVSLRPHPSF